MRAMVLAMLIGSLASSVLGGVSARLYRADETTPLPWADPNVPDVYRDIMVGTRLTLFVGSDTPRSFWSGGLWMSWDDWDKGILAGRGYSYNNKSNRTFNFEGSILEAAGEYAWVIDLPSSSGMRFSLSIESAKPGEWFVLDYHAQTIGTCLMGLYSFEGGTVDPSTGNLTQLPNTVWLQELTFNHVLSRDYNDDKIVNFADFALWAGQWRGVVPTDPNATASADLNGDEAIDIMDLPLFYEYWLKRTDVGEQASEPNLPGEELLSGQETRLLAEIRP